MSDYELVGKCKWCGALLFDLEGRRKWWPEWDGCLHEAEGGGEDGEGLVGKEAEGHRR